MRFGNPIALSLTLGQASDLSQADRLLDEIEPKTWPTKLTVPTAGDHACRPSKANRVEQRDTKSAPYRGRNLVEKAPAQNLTSRGCLPRIATRMKWDFKLKNFRTRPENPTSHHIRSPPRARAVHPASTDGSRIRSSSRLGSRDGLRASYRRGRFCSRRRDCLPIILIHAINHPGPVLSLRGNGLRGIRAPSHVQNPLRANLKPVSHRP